MAQGIEASEGAGAKQRAFYVVWSPQGGDPTVRHDTFGRARHAAWVLSERYPAQEFFVLKSCWGRPARPANPPAGEDGAPDGGGAVDPP